MRVRRRSIPWIRSGNPTQSSRGGPFNLTLPQIHVLPTCARAYMLLLPGFHASPSTIPTLLGPSTATSDPPPPGGTITPTVCSLALREEILDPLDLVLGGLLLVGAGADAHARLHAQHALLVDQRVGLADDPEDVVPGSLCARGGGGKQLITCSAISHLRCGGKGGGEETRKIGRAKLTDGRPCRVHGAREPAGPQQPLDFGHLLGDGDVGGSDLDRRGGEH